MKPLDVQKLKFFIAGHGHPVTVEAQPRKQPGKGWWVKVDLMYAKMRIKAAHEIEARAIETMLLTLVGLTTLKKVKELSCCGPWVWGDRKMSPRYNDDSLRTRLIASEHWDIPFDPTTPLVGFALGDPVVQLRHLPTLRVWADCMNATGLVMQSPAGELLVSLEDPDGRPVPL